MCDSLFDEGWWERNAIYWKSQADDRADRLNRSVAYAKELEDIIREQDAKLERLQQENC